jgi:ribonuclease HI
MKQVRCITINTDASWHPKHKVGGYAFYIVCDLFKIQKGGMFKVHPKSSQDAELMCMANALHTLLCQKELPSTKIIVVNSDALFAFEKIGLKKEGTGKAVAKILKQLRHATSYKDVIMPKFDFRHVKAHNGTNDARSWVNDWCDKEAKKWMRLQIPKETKQIA